MGFIQSISGFFGLKEDESPAVIPGRNEACWCGSGQKYKKCHLVEDEKKAAKNRGMNCGPSS